MSVDGDVVIVGAGVAGSAVALHLAGAGHSVVLVDRAAFPRKKTCGEGLMPHGVHELQQLGLLDAVREVGFLPFRGIAYHVAGQRAVGDFPQGEHGYQGMGIRRWRLDKVLVDACEAHPNIKVHTGCKVERIGVSGSQVIVESAVGDIWARCIIGADGLHSVVRRELGLDRAPSGRKRYGVRAHFQRSTSAPDAEYVEVHIGDRAEYYVTPTAPGEFNIALLLEESVAKQFAGNLEGGFYDLVGEMAPVRELLTGAQPLTTPKLVGPLRQSASGLVSRRAMLVGDAAGFLDGITGEGMSIALSSARLAAHTLCTALDSDRLEKWNLLPYQRAQRRMARDMTRFTEAVLWGIRYPSLAGRVVRNLGRHPDTFSRLLSINTGKGFWQSIQMRDLWRLTVG